MGFILKKSKIAAFAIACGMFSVQASACFINCSTQPPGGKQVNTTMYNDHDLPQSEVDQNPFLTKTQWTVNKTQQTKAWMEGRHNIWSPKSWGDQTRNFKYNQGTYFVAHRGLVDLKKGIAENTLDAVANAVSNEIYMVEIDVQVTKDGVPVALHDDTLRRARNDNKRVDSTNYFIIANEHVFMAEPDMNYRALFSQGQLCQDGNKLMSLDLMYRAAYVGSTVTNLPGNPGACEKVKLRDVTFVWDPKNAKSAQATIAWAGNLSGSRDNPMVMKVYPNFYPTNLGVPERADWEIADLFAPYKGNYTHNRILIMPVIPAMSMMSQGYDETDALWIAEEIVKDWAQHFEVLTVEVPQAKDTQWVNFAQKLNARLAALPNSALPHNFGFRPKTSVGYRFADFAKLPAGTDINQDYTKTFEGAGAWDWSMEGGRQIDNGVKERRRIAGQLAQYGPVCAASGGCYITHDYPVHEIGRWRVADAASPKFKASTVYVDPIHNAPATNIEHAADIIVDGFCSGAFHCTADGGVFIDREAINIP